MSKKQSDPCPRQEQDRKSDRLYDIGFFLVEAFAALEVTAVIVANARITESLGLREELSSSIINSYLYTLFAAMFVVLVFSQRISRYLAPTPFFLTGLGFFAAGNLVCFSAQTPDWFFTGRIVMGVGGAVAFAGQLWTLSVFHRHRITRTLIWGEAGTALGVVAGPIVGALFTQFSPQGWRDFFLLNAAMGLATAVFAHVGLRGRPWGNEGDPLVDAAGPTGQRLARLMTGWQVVVSILVVGAEYLFSDYLQTRAGKSPLFVGAMTMIASVGAILGSLWAGRLEDRLEKVPPLSSAGLLAATGILAVCLSSGLFLTAGVPIFACGLFMGLANVSIYASIVQSSSMDRFLPRSMIYLMGMQIGNALGVQSVGVAELWHLGVLSTAGLVCLVPIVLSVLILGYGRPREVSLPRIVSKG